MDEERCVVGETRVKVLKKDEYIVPFVRMDCMPLKFMSWTYDVAFQFCAGSFQFKYWLALLAP